MIEVSKVLEDRIDIALATYNGEKYITEPQLDIVKNIVGQLVESMDES